MSMLIFALDLPLIDRLTSQPGEVQHLIDNAGQFAVDLVKALIILVVTFWLSGLAANFLRKSVARFNTEHHRDSTLSTFLASLVRYAILIIGLVAVLQQLGVQATSILAVLGAASLAVGLALQGALSNVAAGVMLLILRPYRIGDLVEISGKKGKVRNLDLFVTELTAPDGLRLIMPNAKVLGDMIINYTASGRRRLELKFTIDYGDDANKALAVLLEQAAADKRVFKDPKPVSQVTALADSGVVVTLMAWTNDGDFYNTGPALIGAIKMAFEDAGLTFPYPHQVGLSRAEQAKIRSPRRSAATAPASAKPSRARTTAQDEAPPGESTEGA
jgi:small conductance mechanosensitive channel